MATLTDLDYSPVIIPTLNRYEHLKRCIESLSKCIGADKTDLYVGVDFPPSEQYVEGHSKICEFCKTINGFKNVFVFERDINYGFTKNMSDLRSRVKDSGHYAYILSEDDNEFSKNYLLYMNQCLKKYKDDSKVFSVCGYSYPKWENLGSYKYNAFPLKGFCAWGAGCWFEKNRVFFTFDKSKNLLFNWKYTFKMFCSGHFITVHRMMFRYNNAGGDLRKRYYAILKDKYCIFPAVTKVRNHGFDGSGTNCALQPQYENQKIDENTDFCLDDFQLKEYKELYNIYNKEYGGSALFKLLTVFEYIMFRLTGKCFHDFENIKKMQRKSMNNR